MTMQLYQVLQLNTVDELTHINRHPLVADLVSPGLDIYRYHEILSAHYQWYLHMESYLTKYFSATALNKLGYKFKTPLLQKDLSQLTEYPDKIFRITCHDFFYTHEHRNRSKLQWLHR